MFRSFSMRMNMCTCMRIFMHVGMGLGMTSTTHECTVYIGPSSYLSMTPDRHTPMHHMLQYMYCGHVLPTTESLATP